MDKVHIVCPGISDLEEDCKQNISCPLAGCGKVLPQKQSLKFHIVKVHGIIKDDADWSIAKHVKLARTSQQGVLKYRCPASDCRYGENGSKHFTSCKLLKQHYMKMHAPKRYSCVACRASFGLYRDLTRHEKCCRRRILCATCNVAFSTRAELKRHCQLLEHEEQNINTPHDKETGKTDVFKKSTSNNERNVSVWMHSERGSDVSTGQLQGKGCIETASIRVTNGTILSAPGASHNADRHSHSSAAESTDIADNCTSVTDPHTSSTVVKSRRSCERHESGMGSDNSRRNWNSKPASVSAELRVCKSSSRTVGQSTVALLPKPTCTLLPVTVGVPLLVVVNTSPPQSTGSCAARTLPKIAPRQAGGSTRSTATSRGDALALDRQGINLHDDTDTSLHGKQQKSVASVVTQTSSRARCKTAAAATQTSEWFVLAKSRLSKESRALQMSSKVRRRRPRDVQHNHTQTHGTNQKLRRIAGSQLLSTSLPSSGTETPQWWTSDVTDQAAFWPDVASNATQTAGCPTAKLESIRTQTVESFLSSSQQEDLLNIASKLLSDDVGSSCESNSPFAVRENSGTGTQVACATLPASMSKSTPPTGGGDFLQPDAMFNDIRSQLVDEIPSSPAVMQNFSGNAVTAASMLTLDPLVDELMNVIDNARGQGTSSSCRLTRMMLTSASQTAPDFDAVSTQTVDCDFDGGDIDIDDFDRFIHMETQTTDMLASCFSFADIETQTVNDLQCWDSETQTCFDVLLSPSDL